MKQYGTVLWSLVAVLVLVTAGCVPPAGNQGAPANVNQSVGGAEPSLEVTPAPAAEGDWKIVESGSVTFSVMAPGADSVKLLYRPTIADEAQHVRLREIKQTEAANGKFTSQVNLPTDFAGEVWAEVSYPDGRKAQTKEVALRTKSVSPDGTAPNGASTADPAVSARSDVVTNGKIETAQLAPGQGNLKITINIPAFQLTLWQDGKEIKSYPIGIGRKDFPLPKGNRVARQIIFNPDWIPPDSEWVSEMKGVEPGETYEADDPKNPLGKIKIPLGDAILIHEAKSRAELGGLVSHGCARMIDDDLFDLSQKIIEGQGLEVSEQQIAELKKNKDRKDVALKQPIPVELSYDTAVVEGGKLYLYPDVYDEKSSSVEAVKQELATAKVDAAKLDDQAIAQMLEKVSRKEMVVVDLANPAGGQAKPIVASAGSEKGTKKESTGRKKS